MMANAMSAEQLQHLNESFGLGGAIRFEAGNGGLTRARISSEDGTAEVYLQGAHVTAWQPAGAEHPGLFLSERSQFTPGKAIRGGVPLVFPWFAARGDGLPGPMHGFARTELWSVAATERTSDGIAICFALQANQVSRSYGYDHFSLRYTVTVGRTFQLSLEARNEGDAPLAMEEALHSYFAVGDIRNVSVSGLAETDYIDRADGSAPKHQRADLIQFTGETDQLHLNTTSPVTIHDAAWRRRIVIEKQGSASTVVWNPWQEKAEALADLGGGAWPHMVCVEPANARENRLQLLPGQQHTMSVLISIQQD